MVWTKRSQQHMKAAYKYISEDFSQNARKVVEDIATVANPI
jgi:hypothetical protein